MAATPQNTPISGLARALVQAGRLKETEAEELMQQALAAKIPLIDQIIAAHKASASEIAIFSSETFGYPLLDLDAFNTDLIPKDAIDRKLVAAHRVVPLNKRGNRLSIAIADPTNLRALDEIRFQTGLAVDPIVVDHGKLMPLVAKVSESAEDALRAIADDDINLDFGDEEGGESGADAAAAAAQDIDDAPVVKFIQKILLDAINDGASDIHFEPYEKY